MKSFLPSRMIPNDYWNPLEITIADHRKNHFFFSKMDFWIFEIKLFSEFYKNEHSLSALYKALRDFLNLLEVFEGVVLQNFFFSPDEKKSQTIHLKTLEKQNKIFSIFFF